MKDSNKCIAYCTFVFTVLLSMSVVNYALTMNVDAWALIAASGFHLDTLYCSNETRTAIENKCYYKAIEEEIRNKTGNNEINVNVKYSKDCLKLEKARDTCL